MGVEVDITDSEISVALIGTSVPYTAASSAASCAVVLVFYLIYCSNLF